MLKILSWNIRQGGGTRVNKIRKCIAEVKPHILALNEWRNNAAGMELRVALLRMGYIHQFVPPSTSENAVCIISKFPFNGLLCQEADSHFPNNIIIGQFDAFDLISVYLPHKKKHVLFDFLIDRIRKAERPSIIVGDYNTGHNGIDQKGSSFWYTDELEDLESLGMKDAFRHLHGSVKEYSWFSHQGNGYRYDHTYMSDVLTPFISRCEYLHPYREAGISDHAPMLLVLGNS